jgi:hypothetical protein
VTSQNVTLASQLDIGSKRNTARKNDVFWGVELCGFFGTNVSEHLIVSTFRVERIGELETLGVTSRLKVTEKKH